MATAPLNDQTASFSTSLHGGDHSGIGEVLRSARERRGLTLEQLSRETKLPQRHLIALERGDLAALPGSFYQRAEVRTYARAVGLDPDVALSRLEVDTLPPPARRDAVARASGTPQPAPTVDRRLPIALGTLGVFAIAATVLSPAPPAIEDASSVTSPSAPTAPAAPLPTSAGTVGVGTSGTTESAPAGASQPAGDGAIERRDGTNVPDVQPAAAYPAAHANTAAATTAAVAKPAATPARSGPALLVVTDPPGARVTINGIGWGVTPVAVRYLPPGEKRIRVSLEGYTTEERVVRVGDAPATATLSLRPAPRP